VSKCTLTIQLDRPGGTFVHGDQVAGNVVAQVSADCRCKRLRVALSCRAHGHGDKDNDVVAEQTLFEGAWSAGEAPTFPFALEIPDGPLTYHGEQLNVDWLVVADADIASGLDAHAEEVFTVELGKDASRVPLPRGRNPEQAARFGVAAGILKVIGGLVIGGPGWVVLGLGIVGAVAGQSAAWMGVVAGAVFALAGTMLGIQGVRSLIGTSLLKVTHLSLDPPRCRRGDQMRLTLDFTPRRAIEISEITAVLEVGEVVSCSRGSNRTATRYERSLVRDSYTLGGPPTARPGFPVAVSTTLTLPEDQPCSFERVTLRHHWRLEWKVSVKVAIRGRPDWNRDLILVVSP
jgi:sporulation-control protein spo0M